METSFLFVTSAVLFIAMSLVLLGLIIYGLDYAYKKANLDRKDLWQKVGILLTWIIISSALSFSGFFQKFEALPPRIFLALLVPLVLLFFTLRAKNISLLLQYIPEKWLVNIQSFRVLMEIILWLLFIDNTIPIQMSFEGRNFDILVGLTAPIFAYICFTKNANMHKLALIWNIVGLLLLANIVIIAVLSAPVPFRVFMNEPANTFIASMPFTLLPAFVVPVAFFMHALSIKQLLAKMSEENQKLSAKIA